MRCKRFKELDLADPLIVQLLTGRAFDEADAGSKLDLAGLPTHTRIVLLPVDGSVELSANDVGVGISQVVPVIVVALDDHEGITAIEQPELHLHPAVQVALGDLLISGANSNNRTLLIETHSEHLMLRLLRRIRETTEGELPPGHPGLRPETLSVNYVEAVGGRIAITPLRIDETGEFRDRWPKGFFDERAGELF